ncbi:MAG: C40 family peptidase [Nitrospirota bacterium]|nr:C40 family peptidase [Nitrospirota bacterium]
MFNDLVGKPFKKNGGDEAGFDCQGLVVYALRRAGWAIPVYPSSFGDEALMHELMRQALERHCVAVAAAEAFCVVTFWKEDPQYTTHMGIVLPNGFEFLHVMERTGVVINRLDSLLWKNKITGYYRVINV